MLAGAAATGWVLLRETAAPGAGEAVAPAADPAFASAPPLRELPALRGAPDARPPATRSTSADPGVDATSWRLAFDVVGPDGAPLLWDHAVFYGDRLVERAHATSPGSVASGFLEVEGTGRLAVFATGYRPWASEPLERPISGEHRVVVRPDRGLPVAGEVFAQDGTTPLVDGTVRARYVSAIHPGASPRPFLVQGQVVAGRLRLTGFPPGPVRIEVSSLDRADGRPVELEAQAGDEDLRLVLGARSEIRLVLVDAVTRQAPVTRYLRIDRIDARGTPQPWFASSTTSPTQGEPPMPLAHLEAEPGETHRFRISAEGYRTRAEVEVAVPERGGSVTARIELEPAPGSVCRVGLRLRFDGGAPASVLVRRVHGGGSTGHAYVPEGDVILLELGPGPHHLRVGETHAPSEDGVDWVPVDVHLDLEPGEVRDVDVRFQPGGWVWLGGETDPRPQTVRWRCGDEAREVRAQAHNVGHVRGWLLGLLPPGRWRFAFGDGPTYVGETDVRPGELATVDPKTLEVVAANVAGG